MIEGDMEDIEVLETDQEVLMDQEETFPQDQDLAEREVRDHIFQCQDSSMTIKKTSEDKLGVNLSDF